MEGDWKISLEFLAHKLNLKVSEYHTFRERDQRRAREIGAS